MNILSRISFGLILSAFMLYAADEAGVKSSGTSVTAGKTSSAQQSGTAKVKKIIPSGPKTNWSKIKDLFM